MNPSEHEENLISPRYTPSILLPEKWASTLPLLQELRPNLKKEQLLWMIDNRKELNYELAGLIDSENTVIAVAGYNICTSSPAW